ncbi:hypothetical protein OK015_20150 [Mycobacterium sp. Aquia_216]|uniref:hypothetical protein n=1 Tax=Mycobacterium sp. Aquia_216 TaxID=2991729 RepID=UPI00227B95F5|nr:hypothetical protein [Mycobacterium sp. Aquia_216]WAJ43505.1 hypothetical protein OK015_20150 [Mycobacterium sp. Aquia_216]
MASLTSELISVGKPGSAARLALSCEGAGPEVPQTAMVELPSGGAIGVTLGCEGEVRFYQEIAPAVAIRVPGVH